MRLSPPRGLPWWTLCLLVAGAGVEARLWLVRNGLPDGYQNEYLHVGNALDLWEAAGRQDTWTLGRLLTEGWWPPGFYLWPWPLFAAGGARHEWMVLANLGHLALLLGAVYALGRALQGARAGLLAAVLVMLYPAIFGNLVRYEPSVANAAWVSLAAWALVRSEGFTRLRPALALGVVCGVGLLMDRLTLGVLLAAPALVEAAAGLRQDRAAALRGLAGAALASALSGGWWLVSFFMHNSEELLSQTAAGEIDSTGALTEARGPLQDLLYYPATLLDGQAGLVLGALALGALLLGAPATPGPEGTRARRVLRVLCVGGLVVFTLIQKKQAYYTLPLLGAFAALSAQALLRWGRPWVVVGVLVLGLHQRGLRLWGEGLPLPAALGQPALPEAWVSPRHPMALPPRELALPLDALASAVGAGDVIVFSEDQTWFEGFLVLQLRERLPGRRVRGVITDPQGSYEWVGVAGAVVTVGPLEGPAWPTTARLEAALAQHHYALEELPPVVDSLVQARERFGEVARWELEGVRVSVWRVQG